ncbi:uncharacterized protein LOC131612041 [Vicia villosa]|uniref:uncharacterized protein LOC131612041 n=1 Tax=Vicia villosa TaxID=3911 RepID=UPI00273BA34D|nr:uncharacterized protein LOC131612041 [Vicia villosa]
MDEKQRKKHIREPPSVPFIWETKPGIPIKDWKPMVSSVSQLPKTPLKQIASVPFVWEEKPGTPLPSFSHVDKHEGITSLEFEAFSFDADECLKFSTDIIPMQQSSFSKNTCDLLCTPSCPVSPASSETDGSLSSYATGVSSLTGSAFLECLFPLFPPKSGFLEKNVGYAEKGSSSLVELKGKGFEDEDFMCDVSSKQPTLGELIMMSRRRSCRRKATQMNKWDPPKKITRKQAFGCFSIVTSSSMFEGLLKRKYYPRLKLV